MFSLVSCIQDPKPCSFSKLPAERGRLFRVSPTKDVMPSKWICVSYGLKSKLKNYVVSDRSCFFIAVDVDPMLTIVLAKLILERSPWPGPVICWNCVALLNSFMYSNWSYVFLLSVNSKSYWSLSFSMFVGLFVSFCLLCVVLVLVRFGNIVGISCYF